MADESEVKTSYTAEEVEALIAEKTSGLKNKVDELLGETKTAKQKAAELEALKAQQEEESLKQKEEFKTLYEREQLSRKELAEKYQGLEVGIKKEKTDSAAMRLAGELTKDMKRAELIKKEVLQFAKYTDDGVTFEMGGLTVDKDKVLHHIKETYPFLVDGSGATGGGAAGGNGGSASQKTGNFGGTKSERQAAIASKYNLT